MKTDVWKLAHLFANLKIIWRKKNLQEFQTKYIHRDSDNKFHQLSSELIYKKSFREKINFESNEPKNSLYQAFEKSTFFLQAPHKGFFCELLLQK